MQDNLAIRLGLPIAVMEVGVQNATLAIAIALALMNSPQIALPGTIYGLLMYLPALAMVAHWAVGPWRARNGVRCPMPDAARRGCR